MTERRLATVRRVEEISPIEGSDFLELLTVDGWNAVVPKSDGHSVGDLVVYCETDSFLPIWPEFAFLEKSSLRKMQTADGNRTGYRLRTIKLRGQISEGLVIPLEQAFVNPDGEGNSQWLLSIESQGKAWAVNEGDEVTELLNIIKWELPVHASLAGKVKGNFPSFLRKTDSERIENFIKDFNRKYRNDTWEETTKLDGSSFTAYLKDEEFGVCSRNLDLAESEGNSFWIAARKNNVREKLEGIRELQGLKNVAIQAELMGPGVQGNREGLPDLDIYVFDIYDIDNHTKLDAETRHRLVEFMGLKHVPFHGFHKLSELQTAKAFLERAEGPSINHKVREGTVYKSVENPNVNFKAIANSFKLADNS